MKSKICGVCEKLKPLSAFAKDKYKPSGLSHRCRVCRHKLYTDNKEQYKIYGIKYRIRNEDKVKSRNLAYYYSHKEGRSKKMAEWYKKNRKYILSVCREYGVNHPHLRAAGTAKRRARLLKATPNWANFEKMKKIYEKAAQLTHKTGVQYHVDHRIPLISKVVCGLHCEGNLQILIASKNLSKSNKFIVA